jgi:hypothetical protein
MNDKLYDKNKLLADLQKVGKKLPKEVIIYLIGGCAMYLRELKFNTKDVDAVFTSKEDLKLVETELMSLGYKINVNVDVVYEQLGAYTILRHPENAGFDLFHSRVCTMLALSDAMKLRASDYTRFGNLTVKLLSNEDIVLFKAITDRPRDFDDIKLLISGKSDFDWNVIKNECKSQAEYLRIEGHLYNRLLELLEKHQIRAPILSWLKNRDKNHILRNAYELRLKEGFSHEQIVEQFKKDGFSKKEIALIESFREKK